MRKLAKFIMPMICCFLLFSAFMKPISAAFVPVTGTNIVLHDEMGSGDEIKDPPGYVPEEDETTETAPFIKQAILSIDEDIAAQEEGMNYAKYFYNSCQTAMTKSLNFFDGGSILMALINLVTFFFEMIGLCISLVVMLLYNVAANSFLNTIISAAFDAINAVLFQWNNPSSWIYKILFLFGFISIISYLSKNINKIRSIKQVFPVIIEVFMSGVMVYFVGVYGKPTIDFIEEKASESLTEVFNFGEETDLPIEIQNKELLFETFQMQSFRIRHFGVSTAAGISETDDLTNQERVQKLLENPSKANAKEEYELRENHQIAHSVGQTSQVMLLSLIFLIHRCFLAVIMGALSIVLLAIGVIKVTLVSLSVWQLTYAMLKRDKKSFMWLANRLEWSLLFIMSHIIFNALLYGINLITGELSKYGSLTVLVFDIVIFVIGKYLFKYLPQIISKIKDSDTLETIKGVFDGEMSIPQILNKYGSKKHSSNDMYSDESDESDDEKDTYESNVSSPSFFNPDLGDADDIAEMDTSENIAEETDNKDPQIGTDIDKTKNENLNNQKNTQEKADDSNEADTVDTTNITVDDLAGIDDVESDAVDVGVAETDTADDIEPETEISKIMTATDPVEKDDYEKMSAIRDIDENLAAIEMDSSIAADEKNEDAPISEEKGNKNAEEKNNSEISSNISQQNDIQEGEPNNSSEEIIEEIDDDEDDLFDDLSDPYEENM